MGIKTYQNASIKLVRQELEVPKLEVPNGDLAILGGEGEALQNGF